MMGSKEELFAWVESELKRNDFLIAGEDRERPWGGFMVINENQAETFADIYFKDTNFKDLQAGGKLSPKMLIVAPQKRLSWQYHHRRAEIWNVLRGPIGVELSQTDQEGAVKEYIAGETIKIAMQERHRLIGRDVWGVVAEIWQHTDPTNPSDESDIVRVQDDFGR